MLPTWFIIFLSEGNMNTSIMCQSASQCASLSRWPHSAFVLPGYSWHSSTELAPHISHRLSSHFNTFPGFPFINPPDLQTQGGCTPGHSPLLVVRITVAVVLGICTVALDATGTLLNPRLRASPVVVLLIGFANPPSVRTSVCKEGGKHS